jgi:hypothetical protein
MSTDWHYSSKGKKVGPVSESEIRSLATSGRLSASDLVWQTGQPDWVPASSVPGLFPGPPPLPSSGRTHVRPSGNKKWVVLGIIGGVLLLVFVSLQSMIHNHNRRRQAAIDFHGNEARRSLERVDGLFNELERGKR